MDAQVPGEPHEIFRMTPRREGARGRGARKESEIVAAILQWLAVHRIPALRMNTGAFAGEYKGKSRFVRFGIKGMADIMILMPPVGRAGFIEVKSATGIVRPHQAAFLRWAAKQGCFAAVARRVEDVPQAFATYVAGTVPGLDGTITPNAPTGS